MCAPERTKANDKSNLDVAHHIIHQLCNAKQTYAPCFQGTVLGRARFKAPCLGEQEFPKQCASVLVLLLWYGKRNDLLWVHKIRGNIGGHGHCWGQRSEVQLVQDAVSSLIGGNFNSDFSQIRIWLLFCKLLSEPRWKWFLYWHKLSRNN